MSLLENFKWFGMVVMRKYVTRDETKLERGCHKELAGLTEENAFLSVRKINLCGSAAVS